VHRDSVVDVTVQDAAEAVRAGALLLDVREDFEWTLGHAPDALHIPMSQVTTRSDELPTDRTIVCVCHMGGRSAKVTAALNRGGWKAVNVAGGMAGWLAAGLPVVNDAGEPGSVA
jgi:rhodanese-related sulfurtransferase